MLAWSCKTIASVELKIFGRGLTVVYAVERIRTILMNEQHVVQIWATLWLHLKEAWLKDRIQDRARLLRPQCSFCIQFHVLTLSLKA